MAQNQPSAFGDLLREFRVRAGLSQYDLAEKARISEAAVGALERGIRRAPHRSTIALLVKALGLAPDDAAALEAARFAARSRATAIESGHNLSAETTSFVGRDADVAHLLRLLRRARLVTVTGSGGVGKTRIARDVARRVLGDPWDAVWFVDLAPLNDGDFIAAKIASSIRPPLRVDTVSALAAVVADRRMLLILDNCEHLIAQAAEAAEALLEGCPQVAILATSRERLNVAGEFVYRLPSLSLEPAIDLFQQRAEAIDPHAVFDARNLQSVADIARRLDCIPLAIELTAAHVPVLGLETVRARLHEHLSLSSGRRDLPERQRTVNATIGWSYDILTPEERAFLGDISIFAGGFSLAGAESVCARDARGRAQVLPLLLSLANKSLLNVENSGDAVRYTLLESVRSFGLKRLREADEYTPAARRHARWLAALAADLQSATAEPSAEQIAALIADFDNVRAALTWSLSAPSQDDRALAGTIINGFFDLWTATGKSREHRQWIASGLERIDEGSHPLVVAHLLRDLIVRSQFARTALDSVERAVRLYERSGDRLALAKLNAVLISVYSNHGALAEAERAAEFASTLFAAEHLQGSMLYAAVLLNRSYLRMRQGRFGDARADIAAAEATALAHGDRHYVFRHCYSRRVEVEYAAGNKQAALEIAQRMLESEFRSDHMVARQGLAQVAVLRLLAGDVDGALHPLRELLRLARGNLGFTRAELEYAALALALRGNAPLGARLLGCVRALDERLHFYRLATRRDVYDLLCATLDQSLDPEAIAAAAADGALLGTDEAIDEALVALDSVCDVKA